MALFASNRRVQDWLAAILLGIVEGITEFLPISSTGHLLLAEHWLGLPETSFLRSELFNVGIQSGAVLAVIAVFSERVKQFATRFAEPATREYLLKLGAAFVLTAEVPGLSRQNIEIHAEENRVAIRGERSHGPVPCEQFHRVERGHGQFSRSFVLPEAIDSDMISAGTGLCMRASPLMSLAFAFSCQPKGGEMTTSPPMSSLQCM